jgi:hypothetical protein
MTGAWLVRNCGKTALTAELWEVGGGEGRTGVGGGGGGEGSKRQIKIVHLCGA